MKNIFGKIKQVFDGKKELSTKELYAQMDSLLQQVEEDVGGNFFPQEKTLSTDEVHYLALRLKSGANFEMIQKKYSELKKKYNPAHFEKDEVKYKKALELDARVEMAYSYFKSKYDIKN